MIVVVIGTYFPIFLILSLASGGISSSSSLCNNIITHMQSLYTRSIRMSSVNGVHEAHHLKAQVSEN